MTPARDSVDAPTVEPKPRRRVRRAADWTYSQCTRRTAWIDHPRVPKEPTESQKFRANVLLTCVGSLLFSVIIGFAFAAYAHYTELKEGRESRQVERIAARNQAIERFTEKVPRCIYLTYRQCLDYAYLLQRPSGVKTAVAPGRLARLAGATDLRDSMSTDGKRTWREVSTDFAAGREEAMRWGDAAGPCLQLEGYLAPGGAAAAAIKEFRLALAAMLSDNLATPEAVEKHLEEVNALWDKATEAVSSEITR